MKSENELSRWVIGDAIRVHEALGPGLLENAYQECLLYQLRKSGFRVDSQMPIPIKYEEIELNQGFRADLVVEGILLLEIKSVQELQNIHFAQTLTYLKLGNFRLGLLINFNVMLLKQGIHRLVNTL
jgi:GxxExxY protein